RIVDHRLVIDRHELLRHAEGDGPQPRAGATGQNDSAHACLALPVLAVAIGEVESLGPLPAQLLLPAPRLLPISQARVNLRQRRGGGVLIGKNRIGAVNTPVDAQLRVERVHPELPVRIISLGDQVVQHRGLGAGDEAVPHPDRYVHRVVIGLAEGDLDVLAEGRGTDPQVHQDVDHLAGQATDEFRLPRWYFGQVDAPNDVPAAAGDVRLRDVEGISQVLGELGGAEALVEAAASVPENPWGEQPGTGDGEVDDGWLGGRVQGAEVNRQLCG